MREAGTPPRRVPVSRLRRENSALPSPDYFIHKMSGAITPPAPSSCRRDLAAARGAAKTDWGHRWRLALHPVFPPTRHPARCSTISAVGAWRRQGGRLQVENGFSSRGKEPEPAKSWQHVTCCCGSGSKQNVYTGGELWGNHSCSPTMNNLVCFTIKLLSAAVAGCSNQTQQRLPLSADKGCSCCAEAQMLLLGFPTKATSSRLKPASIFCRQPLFRPFGSTSLLSTFKCRVSSSRSGANIGSRSLRRLHELGKLHRFLQELPGRQPIYSSSSGGSSGVSPSLKKKKNHHHLIFNWISFLYCEVLSTTNTV